jgi:hypothetical protein
MACVPIKAMLHTLCGCTKIVEVDHPGRWIDIPIAHVFTSPADRGKAPAYTIRRFEVSHDDPREMVWHYTEVADAPKAKKHDIYKSKEGGGTYDPSKDTLLADYRSGADLYKRYLTESLGGIRSVEKPESAWKDSVTYAGIERAESSFWTTVTDETAPVSPSEINELNEVGHASVLEQLIDAEIGSKV